VKSDFPNKPVLLFLYTSVFSIAIAFLTSGCATIFQPVQNTTPTHLSSINVQTNDRHSFTFAEDSWRLTFNGIEGHTLSTDKDGLAHGTDTTLSYWAVSSAAASGGRSSSMTQFLLTILGVILIIGLAAVVLYAAFLATDR